MPLAAPKLGSAPVQPHRRDWTDGPAKTFAAIVLGAAAVVGISWSILAGRPAPTLSHSTPSNTTSPTAGTTPDPADAPKSASIPKASASKRINLNTSGPDELQLLPGIGPALAARIIEDRTQHGAFKSVDDLDRVKGIGPKTIDKLRDLACVE